MTKRIKKGFAPLTDREMCTAIDLVLGLTDQAMAARRGVAESTIEMRVYSLASKLLNEEHSRLEQIVGRRVFNLRSRIVFEILRRGIFTVEQLQEFDIESRKWMALGYGVERTEKTDSEIRVPKPSPPLEIKVLKQNSKKPEIKVANRTSAEWKTILQLTGR